MAKDIYGITPIVSGLNNQRIALLGLIGIAHLEGAKVSLPKTLVDYTPLPQDQTPKEHPTLPFDAVFDEAHLRQGLQAYDIFSDEAATEILPHDDCFRIGSEYLSALAGSHGDAQIVADFLKFCRAAPELRDVAKKALALAGDQPPLMLQLRIERDWRDYLLRRPHRSDDGETTVDPRRIFGKIGNTPALADHRLVLACCDEGDLLQTRDELKKDAADFELNLVFKSEIEEQLELPTSRLQRSAIDFEMCLMSDRYVGLTRSSFSNMVCLLKSLQMSPDIPEHYIYNSKSREVVRRWDMGLRTGPAEAAEQVPVGKPATGKTWAQHEMKRQRLKAASDLVALRRAKNGQIDEYKRKLRQLGEL
ncbi:hypothetical protein [Falsirhodobacter sp. 1013]|uniref:hypothetical protein n=1 Tax=Falsirhodobacter sp. 1013 TaxID=3417566 RepID=UPI003EBC5001